MYLSEGKRAEIQKCFENQQSNARLGPEFNPGQNKKKHIKGFHDTARGRKVSQILFDVRDGKEVFTPF